MANRRDFLTMAGAGGLALGGLGMGDSARAMAAVRDLYELRSYELSDQAQGAGLEKFLAEAAIPALNRAGVDPVGVFVPLEGEGPVRVLLRHRSAESLLTLTARLMEDAEFRKAGAAVVDATADKPAYGRVESQLFLAFRGMPEIETPVKTPGRIFQLRIYESPSVKTNQKKIEMFSEAGEIAIFRRTGLAPVFFGEAIVGSRLPNLTYMLAFHDREELDRNWKTFVADPEWKSLSGKPEYADKAILSKITNILLKPAACSQV